MKKLVKGDKIKTKAGELEYLEEGKKKPPSRERYVKLKCICNNEFTVLFNSISSGRTNSCGCWNRQIIKNKMKNPKMGYLEALWANIKQRCFNINSKDYQSYGGRGITIFSEWKDNSKKFIEDILKEIGHRPTEKHSFDRKDNNKNYEPGNLRWASFEEQARNKRTNLLITINNKTKTLTEWAKISGVSQQTISRRLRDGWDIEKLLEPVKKIKRVQYERYYLECIWQTIKQKCFNSYSRKYKDYGGRGISLYLEWQENFSLFQEWVISNIGNRTTPSHQLDRIDNNKGYEPGNLRWSTPSENCRNRRSNRLITINNETKTLAEWAGISGLKFSTILKRLNRGITGKDLLNPIQKCKFSQKDVEDIREKFQNGISSRNIAKIYKVDKEVITNIVYKRGAYKQ